MGKRVVSFADIHANATSKRWHLWEIDLRFAPGLPPGWVLGSGSTVKSWEVAVWKFIRRR